MQLVAGPADHWSVPSARPGGLDRRGRREQSPYYGDRERQERRAIAGIQGQLRERPGGRRRPAPRERSRRQRRMYASLVWASRNRAWICTGSRMRPFGEHVADAFEIGEAQPSSDSRSDFSLEARRPLAVKADGVEHEGRRSACVPFCTGKEDRVSYRVDVPDVVRDQMDRQRAHDVVEVHAVHDRPAGRGEQETDMIRRRHSRTYPTSRLERCRVGVDLGRD